MSVIKGTKTARLAADVHAKSPSSWWDDIKNFKEYLTALIAELKGEAERIASHLVRIAVVFLLQTLVLPILFLWLMLALGRRLITGNTTVGSFNNLRKG